jgi:hypothetical protein
MASLAILLTGQIRTFFTKQVYVSFQRMIETSKKHYASIYVFCIVSDLSMSDRNQLESFLSGLSLGFTIDDYNKYIPELHQVNQERLLNPTFITMADIYNSTNGEIQKIMSPTHHSNYYCTEPFAGLNRIYHQLEKAILLLLEYETSNMMRFDMCMKLRFDTRIIDPAFYPHIPTGDMLDRITFNTSIRNTLQETMKKLGITTLKEYAQFMKDHPIQIPQYISKYSESSFGSYFLNNYISIQNILNGSEDIIYTFVDHLTFARRDVFVKLQHIFRDYAVISSDLNQRGMQAFFCPEVQMLVYCFHNGITPLMYTHHSLFELVR